MKKYLLILFLLIPIVTASLIYDNPKLPHLNPSISSGGGNITTFLQLLDTPNSYGGQATNCIKVNAEENALEFGSCGTGGTGSSYKGDGTYLYNSSTTMFLNETKLNLTIDNRGSTSGWITNTVNNLVNYFTKTEVDNMIQGNKTSLNIGYYINYTPITTTGNITNGTLKGYLGANAICNYYYSGSHMCQASEIMNSINRNQSNTNFTATFRITEVAPGYLANANDCDALTSPTSSDLGAIWVGSTTHASTYGSASLVSCSASRAIGCCL